MKKRGKCDEEMVGEVDEFQQESDGAGEGWQCKQGPNLTPSRMKIVAGPCETVGGRCEKNGTGYEKMCVTCMLHESWKKERWKKAIMARMDTHG